jgi:hypothetical protein
MKARDNPGLHRVGQQLGTELRKKRVKGTDEKDLVKNDHEDSARSSGVTGTRGRLHRFSSGTIPLWGDPVTAM